MKTPNRFRLDAAGQGRALSCLRLAYQLAGRYAARTSLPREDAEAAALDGLLRAAARYDEGRGACFLTFAHFYIRRRLQRALDVHVRGPRQLSFTRLCQRDPDNYFDPADPTPAVDALEAAEEAARRHRLLDRVAGVLSPRLWEILRLYYGDNLTLEEVGRRVGPFGKERARQLLSLAVRQARAALPELVEGDPVPRQPKRCR